MRILDFACPTCAALVAEPCRVRGGAVRKLPHAERVREARKAAGLDHGETHRL